MTHLKTLVDIGSDVGDSVAGKPFDVARRELVDCLLAVARGYDDATDGSVLNYARLQADIKAIGTK